MSAPQYSPAGGYGSTATSGGVTYLFEPSGWKQISSGGSAPKTSNNSVVKQNGGWYDGVQYWEPGKGPDSGTNQSVQDSMPSVNNNLMNEINKIYGPAISDLDTLRNNANEQYQDALGSTNKAYGLAKEHSQETYDASTGLLKDNRGELESDKNSALNQAIRSYQALEQQRIARFGGSSSSGEALGELSRQEFFRGQSSIEKEFISSARDLQRQEETLNLQHKQYTDQLELQQQEALQGLKSELNSKLAQIQSNKTQLESAKASARLSVIQDAINQQNQIKLAFKERASQIMEAIAVKKAEISGNYAELEARAQAYDSGVDYTNEYSDSNLTSNQSQSRNPNYNYNPYSQDDELSQFVNPFYQNEGGVSRTF